MVRVTRAKNEKRASDRKKKRLVLILGKMKIHITREEAASLLSQLKRFKL